MTQTLLSTQPVSNVVILNVSKTGSTPIARVGDTLVYTLNDENAGNQIATTVRLTDTLPAGLTVVGTSQLPVSQTTQYLAWNPGNAQYRSAGAYRDYDHRGWTRGIGLCSTSPTLRDRRAVTPATLN